MLEPRSHPRIVGVRAGFDLVVRAAFDLVAVRTRAVVAGAAVVVAALVVIGAAGCYEPQIPEDLPISCAGAGAHDCPALWHCTELDRCVPDDNTDRTGPEVTEASTSPGVVAAGAVVTARIVVNEALGRDPVVLVLPTSDPTSTRAFVVDEDQTDRAKLTWVLVATADGSEGQMKPRADLIDVFANRSSHALDAVVVDDTGPGFTISIGAHAAFKADDVVTFSGTASEPLTPISARLVDQDGNTVVPAGDPVVDSDSYAWSASLAGADLSTVSSVSAEAVVADAVGNVTTATTAAVPIDVVAPTGSIAFTPGGLIASTSAVITVSGASADVTGACVRGDITAAPASCEDGDFVAWTLASGPIDVSLTDVDGEKIVIVELRDGAGNVSAPLSASVTYVRAGVVGALPTLTLPGVQTRVKDGDNVIVSGSTIAGAVVVTKRLVDLADESDVLGFDGSGVAVDESGAIVGSFTLPSSSDADGHSLALELVVRFGDIESDAAHSRSAPVVVDDSAPTAAVLLPQAGAGAINLASPAVTLALSVSGAVRYRIDGDLVSAVSGSVNGQQPILVGVLLTSDSGLKSLVARFFDEADNEADAQLGLNLSTDAPGISVALTNRALPGVLGAKPGDLIDVSGAASSGSTIVSRALVFSDDGAGSCQVPVGAGAGTLLPGVNADTLSGSVAIPQPCSTGALVTSVALQIIVQSPAGIPSDASASTSVPLYFDGDAPTVTATISGSVGANAGSSSSATVTLHVSAADVHPPLQVRVSGDVTGSGAGAFVDAPGIDVGPGIDLALTLAGGDGAKNVDVSVRDEVGNASTAQTLHIALDTLAPVAPLASLVQFAETATAPDDPGALASSSFTVAGASGAVEQNARVRIFADAALTSQLLEIAAGSDGSFAAQAVPGAGKAVFAVTVDAAGNASAPTRIEVPSFVATGLPAHPIGPGALSFTVTSSVASGPFTVSIGNASTVVSGAGNARAVALSIAAGDVDVSHQGLLGAVLRVSASASALAAGSVGTSGAAVSVDVTAPAIDVAALALVQGDPGSADSVSGLVGAVLDKASPLDSDDIDDVFPPTVVVTATGSAPATRVVGPDGSFASAVVGDNLTDTVVVTATDAAGNVAAVTLQNDRTAPTLSAVTTSLAVAKAGQAFTIDFTVVDAAHDLRAPPVVTVGGRAATPVSTELVDVSPTLRAMQFTFTPSAALDVEGLRTVSVQVTDGAGNAVTRTTSVRLDFTAPVVGDDVPGAATAFRGAVPISGTASDAGAGASGVALVKVTLERVTGGGFFDGTGFNSPTPVSVNAAGTTSWSLAGVAFADGATYRVSEQAIDVAGNASAVDGPHTFLFDATPPSVSFVTPPPANGVAVDVPYVVTSGSPDTVGFQCAVDAGAFVDCPAAGPLPDVPIGPHTLFVVAIDAAGNTSAVPASAPFHIDLVLKSVRGSGAGGAVCGIAQDDTGWCWGNNMNGHLGFGVPAAILSTPAPLLLGLTSDVNGEFTERTRWRDLSSNGDVVCGVRADRRLACWGFTSDPLTTFDTTQNPQLKSFDQPQDVSDQNNNAVFADVVALSADTGCVAGGLGLACWGQAVASGQPSTLHPSTVDTSDVYDKLAFAVDHGCAMSSTTGHVVCFGSTAHDKLNIIPGPARALNTFCNNGCLDFAVGTDHTCVILADGSLNCAGDGTSGALGNSVLGSSANTFVSTLPPGSASAVAAVDAGTCVVTNSGKLHCFGTGPFGELGAQIDAGTPSDQDVNSDVDWASATGFAHTLCATKNDGSTLCLGNNGSGELGDGSATSGTSFSGPTLAVTPYQAQFGFGAPVFSPAGHTVCQSVSGNPTCGGDNRFAQLGDGTRTSRATTTTLSVGGGASFALGDNFTCLLSGGQAQCAGATGPALGRGPGPPGPPVQSFFQGVQGSNNYQTIAAGPDTVCAAGSGSTDCWGTHTPTGAKDVPTAVTGAANLQSLRVARSHACGIQFGSMLCFGDNTLGELGRGNTTPSTVAAPANINSVAQFDAGGQTTCALSFSGSGGTNAFCWGDNTKGQAGQPAPGGLFIPGQTAFVTTPTAISVSGLGVTSFEDISVGDTRACAVGQGSLVCWGEELVAPLLQSFAPFDQASLPHVVSTAGWRSVIVRGDHVCGNVDTGNGQVFACLGDETAGVFGDGVGFKTTPSLVEGP